MYSILLLTFVHLKSRRLFDWQKSPWIILSRNKQNEIKPIGQSKIFNYIIRSH